MPGSARAKPRAMARAAAGATLIIGEHDFTSFAAADPDAAERAHGDEAPQSNIRSNVRRIDKSSWHVVPATADAPELLLYRVTGSGFLHHMVRNLVGTFLDCAAGRIAPEAIPAILQARDRFAAGPTAPARGLFLHDVEY